MSRRSTTSTTTAHRSTGTPNRCSQLPGGERGKCSCRSESSWSARADGSGIAEVACTGRVAVVLRDITDDALRQGIAGIEKSTARLVETNVLSADDRDATLARITTTRDLVPASEADIVVEAIFEQLESNRSCSASWTGPAEPTPCSGRRPAPSRLRPSPR